MPDTEVLIVGAGPTGLVLALWLTKLGIRVRIIDKAKESGTTSRALVMHARNLEFYQQLGIAQKVVDAGSHFAAVNLWVNGELAGRIPFGDIGTGISPFPFMLILPQDVHERVLIAELARVGVHVERETELVSFTENAAVRAELRGSAGQRSTCECAYIAGCDGARSTVREQLGIGFPGGTYDGFFYVADVEGTGPVLNGEMNGILDSRNFLAAFPMKGTGRARLVGQIRADGEANALRWDDVDKHLLNLVRTNITTVHWFSTYRVHHRVADTFRKGRAFLLGDAGHIHSPVGGQGMNTGIGDAVNLAWKLAAVLRNQANQQLLDSYEVDRIEFARGLVASTDRGFAFISSPSLIARFIRLRVAPLMLPALLRIRAARRFLFRTVSQTALHYGQSPLSEGKAGRVRGGQRLPWIPFTHSATFADNFVSLSSVKWQVHVYGEATAALRNECARRHLALSEFPFGEAERKAGMGQNAAYVLRPDGYVGLAEPAGDAATVARYLDAHGIRL